MRCDNDNSLKLAWQMKIEKSKSPGLGEKCGEIKQTIKNIILAGLRNSVTLPVKHGDKNVIFVKKCAEERRR